MTPTGLMEPEDLLKLPDGDRFELVDGVPLEKPMSAKSDRVTARLIGMLDRYCVEQRLGFVFVSTRYRCIPNKPNQIRKPDVSFIARGRFPNDEVPDSDIFLVSDLIAEVASPNDGYEELTARIMDFKAAKTRLIWVISPHTKTVLVRRLNGEIVEIDAEGELSGEDVVPGFTCKVAELFL
jgi:Uma2 family endonuclease